MRSIFRRSRYRYRRARVGQQPFFQSKGEGEYASPEGGPSFFGQSSQPTIQTKLTIGQPDDKYEREADSMADRVVNQQPTGQFDALATPTLQTKCSDCAKEEGVQRMAEEEEPAVQTMQEEEDVQRMEEEEPTLQKMEEEEVQTKEEEEPEVQAMEEEEVQAKEEDEEKVQTKPLLMRKSAGGRSVGTPALSSKLSSSKGGGQPMSPGMQAQMGQSFGRDFGAVRIHTDKRAAEMNVGLNARAFTHGTDIYFKSAEYRPESTEGKRLLAHELTHVVQQGGTSLKRNNSISSNHISRQGLLSRSQETSAISYNRRRYDAMSSMTLQRISGAGVDGIIGRLTVEAIATYQSNHGLQVDGKVGEQTLRSIIPELDASSDQNEAIHLIMDFYNMSDFGALLSISYDASLAPGNASTGGHIPGPSTVRIGPNAFARGFAGLVHTIKHELEHVRQRRDGIRSRDVREFLGEAVEIMSVGMPEENVAGFFSDARRALRHFNNLSDAEKRSHWARFTQVRSKVRSRFAAATAAQQTTHQPTVNQYNAVTRP